LRLRPFGLSPSAGKAGLLLLACVAACTFSRPENQRAKERIFSAHPVEAPPPAQIPIDLATLASTPAAQDHALGMGEEEAAARLGSFRLHGTLNLSFSGPGQKIALTEDRLVEQAADGDLHLRLLESTGSGLELVLSNGRLVGRSRYGPYVEREITDELPRQRDEVFGVLGSLYRASNRGWKLSAMDMETIGGRSCQRFDLGHGAERPVEDEAVFNGRLDPDSQKHFEFLYGRALDSVKGSVCLDRQTGVPLSAKVQLLWSARGDAGVAEIKADLNEAIEKAGEAVAVESPPSPLPIPHRPRGQAAALERFGFLQRTDGGTLVAADGNPGLPPEPEEDAVPPAGPPAPPALAPPPSLLVPKAAGPARPAPKKPPKKGAKPPARSARSSRTKN
jgi:hypothetical protein